MATITARGWKNKKGTAEEKCVCDTWRDHWVKHSHKPWPEECSVLGCSNKAILGAHVINSEVEGTRIIPMCGSCNQNDQPFTVKDNTTLTNANKTS